MANCGKVTLFYGYVTFIEFIGLMPTNADS